MPKAYNQQEQQLIVDKFLKSGMNKKKFCILNNISEASLYRWLRQPIQSESEKIDFIQINKSEVKQANPKISGFGSLKVKLPNAVEFEINVDNENLDVIAFIETLRKI